MDSVILRKEIQEMDKIMEILDSIRIDCVGCTERTLVGSIFLYSFVCLRCVMPVSVHYRLYSVTVRTKVLHNGRLVRFKKRADYWCAFSWSIYNQNGHFVRCIHSSSVHRYDGIHSHGKTLSATRTSGRKPKLTERDRRTLKRTVSKNDRTTAAKVTPELNIHLVDPVRRELHKSNMHSRTAIAKPLITENNAKRRKG